MGESHKNCVCWTSFVVALMDWNLLSMEDVLPGFLFAAQQAAREGHQGRRRCTRHGRRRQLDGRQLLPGSLGIPLRLLRALPGNIVQAWLQLCAFKLSLFGIPLSFSSNLSDLGSKISGAAGGGGDPSTGPEFLQDSLGRRRDQVALGYWQWRLKLTSLHPPQLGPNTELAGALAARLARHRRSSWACGRLISIGIPSTPAAAARSNSMEIDSIWPAVSFIDPTWR
jgi:hypothetical protein